MWLAATLLSRNRSQVLIRRSQEVSLLDYECPLNADVTCITEKKNTQNNRKSEPNYHHLAKSIFQVNFLVRKCQFHWSLFLGVQWHYVTIGSDDGLAPSRWQAIIWIYDGLCYWHICASVGLSELTHCGLVTPWGDKDLVNIGSGNGLLSDGTKPLLEPNLTSH